MAHAKLTGKQFGQIRDALLVAFDRETLIEMVRIQLGERLLDIVDDGTFRTVVFGLVEWAERKNRVADLIRGAYEANPDHEALQALVVEAEGWTQGSTAGAASEATIGGSLQQQIRRDRYQFAVDLNQRLASIATGINRAKSGKTVPGLYDGNEIVPLTAVFEELAAKRFLLSEQIHALFYGQAQALLALANASTPEQRSHLAATYARNLELLTAAIQDEFGLSTQSNRPPGSNS